LEPVSRKTVVAIIALLLLVPSISEALEPAHSSNFMRETVGAVTNRAYQPGPGSIENHGLKPKSGPVRSSSPIPQKPTRAPSVGGDRQPVVPEFAGLPNVKRNLNPQFKPAALRKDDSVTRTPRVTKPRWSPILSRVSANNLKIKAKALFCVDRSSNRVILAENVEAPLPIASITKLLTAMIVIDDMDLTSRVVVPYDIREVEKHTVGIRAGEIFSVNDLLHGMLIESGNDCAEALARAYPHGGRAGFIRAMNRRASELGASSVKIYTPSGLDHKLSLGRKDGRELPAKKPNISTAQDVALVADHAFRYPLIAQISSMKTYTMKTLNEKTKDYPLFSNDKLLHRNLPVAGAKTGFTNMAGRCIVALFKDDGKEHLVVVLNTAQHFKAAEKIYRWAAKSM
jgi:D-alanyl-D-alanine carboxypeptidase